MEDKIIIASVEDNEDENDEATIAKE